MQTLIAEINRAADMKAAEDYCFMETQKIRKALAPALVAEFRDGCKGECEGVTRAGIVHFEDMPPYEWSVRNLKSGKVAFFRYDPEVPCVHYETPSISGHFGFLLSQDGTYLMFSDRGLPRLIRELKHKIFKTLV
jgi:hypothetical protein